MLLASSLKFYNRGFRKIDLLVVSLGIDNQLGDTSRNIKRF